MSNESFKAYDKIDRLIRNHTDDTEYAEYLEALDVVHNADQAEIAGLKRYAATLAVERDAKQSEIDFEEKRFNDLSDAFAAVVAERDALAKELAESKENHRIYYDAWVKSQKACAAAQMELAEIKAQSGPVPDFRGYAAMGTAQYLLYACPATKDLPPELVIVPATEEEKAGRIIGDLKECEPGLTIPPERIAIRIAFFSVDGLDALEQQLRILREESFPTSIANPAPADTDGERPTNTEVLEAIGRGWCHESTQHKEMDSTLALAILEEVMIVINGTPRPTLFSAIAKEGKNP